MTMAPLPVPLTARMAYPDQSALADRHIVFILCLLQEQLYNTSLHNTTTDDIYTHCLLNL